MEWPEEELILVRCGIGKATINDDINRGFTDCGGCGFNVEERLQSDVFSSSLSKHFETEGKHQWFVLVHGKFNILYGELRTYYALTSRNQCFAISQRESLIRLQFLPWIIRMILLGGQQSGRKCSKHVLDQVYWELELEASSIASNYT